MHDIEPDASPTLCCGPGIVDFSKITSLDKMAGHIYGRLSLLTNPERPHMFIRELKLYIDNLQRELEIYYLELSTHTLKYFQKFKQNLLGGIAYYQRLADEFRPEIQVKFLSALENLHDELSDILILDEVTRQQSLLRC